METITVYKLFRQEADGLHPLFIDSARLLQAGAWIESDAPSDNSLKDLPTGFSLIDLWTQKQIHYSSDRPTPHIVNYASQRYMRWVQVTTDKRGKRKVYDLGIGSNGQVLRFAHRPGWHSSATPSLPGVNMDGKVWAECQIPADDYYILRRNVSGLAKTHEPIEWYISQKLLIVRVLPQATQAT